MRKTPVAALLFALFAANASVAENKPKIGFLCWQPPSAGEQLSEFRAGLREFGYVDGDNIEIDAHFVDGNRERAQEIAARFVREGVDVIVALPTPAIHVAKQATRTIPIVMGSVADPIATGLVESLAHPGGNITGVTTLSPDLSGKRIELLREIKPEIRSIAFLGLRDDQNTGTFLRETQAAANQLGITLIEQLVDPDAIDDALFMGLHRRHVEAVIVQPAFLGRQDQIVGLAMKHDLPVIGDRPIWAKAGALMTYGPDTTAQIRRAAYYVDRILKGTKPSELPVEQPTEFQLVINAKTAKNLGLTIPQSVLLRADQVLE